MQQMSKAKLARAVMHFNKTINLKKMRYEKIRTIRVKTTIRTTFGLQSELSEVRFFDLERTGNIRPF